VSIFSLLVLDMSNSSSVILDARLSLEMPRGDPVTAGFVGADDPNLVSAELARWCPLPIPEAERSELDKRAIGVMARCDACKGTGKDCRGICLSCKGTGEI